MALLALFLLLLLLLLLTQHAYGLPSQDFNGTTNIHALSFSASIIHKDAPSSPFYNPNLTISDSMKLKIIRSKARHRYFKSLTDPSLIQAPVFEEIGEYIMKYYIGNPPVQTYGVVDTGSDVVWLQCEPCEVCYKQDLPIFHPLNSSTYKFVMYEDPRCRWLADGGRRNEWDRHTCMYHGTYADDSSSDGHLSIDTFWFDQQNSTSNIALESKPDVVFGCGIKNLEKNQDDVYPPGVILIGLDRTNLSLVSQLGVSRFSYCLSPIEDTKIIFGSSALMIGDKIPLLNIRGVTHDLYYVTLMGISIQTYFDYQWLPIPPNTFDLTPEGDGGVLIDSGTPITRIPAKAFNILVSHLKDRIDREPYDNEGLKCFHGTLRNLEVSNPKVMFQFNGTELVLRLESLWMEHTEGWCLAVISTNKSTDPAVIGTHQLVNHNVGYDLIDNVLYLQPMDCSTNAYLM